MGISLKNKDTNFLIDLPPELFWSDEFKWNKVKGTKARTITGALVVQTGVAVKGRPITLVAPNDMNWISRAQLELLTDWSENPALVMELKLNYEGVPTKTFDVSFDYEENPIDAEPVSSYESPKPEDEFRVTLKFIEV